MHTKWHLDPSSRFASIDIDRKVLGCCPPPPLGAGGSLSNTMSPGPRPTSLPSCILMHPTVWPQYTNVTDRTDIQDRQQSDSIGWTVLQTVAQKPIRSINFIVSLNGKDVIPSVFQCYTITTTHCMQILTRLIVSTFTFHLFLANVNSPSRVLYAIARPSVVCLSVTFVRPAQAVEIFGHPLISTENFMKIVPGEPFHRWS